MHQITSIDSDYVQYIYKIKVALECKLNSCLILQISIRGYRTSSDSTTYPGIIRDG